MELLQGTIIRAQSGFYDVLAPSGQYVCRLRGRLKRGPVLGDIASVGDRVLFSPGLGGSGSIESVLPRQRALIRMAPNPKGAYQQVLLANPDLVVLVFACTHPDPHLGMLDRFLVIVEQQHIPALILANKIDLVEPDQAHHIFQRYESLGYPVLYTSALTGQG